MIILRKTTLDLSTFFSVILFKFVLDITYLKIIAPLYFYQGLLVSIDLFKVFESYILLALIYLLIPKNFEKPSNIILAILILVTYVPMLTFYQSVDQSRVYMYLATFFWALTSALIRFLPQLKKPKKVNRIWEVGKKLGLIFLGITFIILFIRFGLSLNFSFNVFKIDILRLEYQSNLSSLINYFFNWSAFIINPFLLGFFWLKGRKILIIFPLIFQLLLFSVTGLKSYIFLMPLVLFLVVISKLKKPLMLISIFITLTILIEVFLFFVLSGGGELLLISRRALIVPAQLSFYYYEFFLDQSALLLSGHRFFGMFFEYPYSLEVPRIIGDNYLGSPEWNATNGIISDAFVNFKYYGFIIWPIIIAIYFKIVDSLSVNKTITLSTLAVSVYVLANAALLTSFLTHGLLLGLLVLFFYYNFDEHEN